MRALYVGYVKGTENHGDEALIWILRDLLAPEIEVVTSGTEYDIALLGGGTLINQSPWLIDHFASILAKAKLGMVLGTGVGDLAFWGNTFDRWVPLLRRCAAVGVRGPLSEQLLRSHGYDDAVVCGDPYLWLHAPVLRPPVPKRLGVCIGSTNNSLWGTNDADVQAYVGAVLSELRRRGWTFSFLSVWSQDMPVLEALRVQAGDAAVGEVFDSRSQPLETYSMLAGCTAFLGEKLHANAMAAVAGTPFIALEYQPKVRDFAASLQMEDWVVSTAERDVARLVSKIEALAERREPVREVMTGCRDDLRRGLESFVGGVKANLLQPAAARP